MTGDYLKRASSWLWNTDPRHVMSGHVALGKMTVMKMAVQAKVFSLVLTCSVSTCGSMILMILVVDCVEYCLNWLSSNSKFINVAVVSRMRWSLSQAFVIVYHQEVFVSCVSFAHSDNTATVSIYYLTTYNCGIPCNLKGNNFHKFTGCGKVFGN